MFHRCSDPEDAKKIYKKLALRLHPDLGGDTDLMNLLNESYQLACKIFEQHKQYPPKDEEPIRNEKIFRGDERTRIFDKIYENKDMLNSQTLDFYFSILEFYDQNEFITSKQYHALVNVYRKIEIRMKSAND